VQRVEFRKTMTQFFEAEELGKRIFFQRDFCTFDWNEYRADAIEEIYPQFLVSLKSAVIIGAVKILRARKRRLVRQYHFMQDGATPYCTKEVSEAIFKVYENRVIALRYPKFAHKGIKRLPCYPDLSPIFSIEISG